MKHNLLKILTTAVVLIVFNRCAQIGVLSGGTKDTVPPKLLLAVPEQKTLNFNSELITLKFDEFIQLRDLNGQLVISPKLKTKPDITVSGKKIEIQLNKAELLPNTTYRFYFGKAIADMHEGNALPNFSYVFSTGPTIDTLSIKGTVNSALYRTPEKDVVVGLYFNKNLEDSFPLKNTPDYVTRTDEAGAFIFDNLPTAAFKLVCFTDKNKDYLYNGAETDQIGFLDNSIELKSDSSFKLDLFKEMPSKTFIKKVVMTEHGKGLIFFNQKTLTKLATYDEKANADLLNQSASKESDTCEFYYRNFNDTLWLKTSYGIGSDLKTDTLNLKIPALKLKKGRGLTFTGNVSLGRVEYFSTPYLTASSWIDTTQVNTNGLHLFSLTDTLVNKEKVKISWKDGITFRIDNKLKEKEVYQLKIDSAAFKSFNGNANDSLKFAFGIVSKSDFGVVNIKLTLNKKQHYIVQLLNKANQVVREAYISFALSATNTAEIKFQNMIADTYRMRIIYDNNEDKTWNTGNFLKKINPEKTYIFEKVIKIMPDWELEEEFILKE